MLTLEHQCDGTFGHNSTRLKFVLTHRNCMQLLNLLYFQVAPGETALAFYTAKNPTDLPVTGISTYNVIPFEAGAYFNKIQCFCFEEQQLNPHEEVDMPVFFYIDPEIVADPKMEFVDTITLSYTFFESKDGFNLPLPPSYAKAHQLFNCRLYVHR